MGDATGHRSLGALGRAGGAVDLFPLPLPTKLVISGVMEVVGSNEAVVPTRWRLQDGRTLLMNTTDRARTAGAATLAARSVLVEASAP